MKNIFYISLIVFALNLVAGCNKNQSAIQKLRDSDSRMDPIDSMRLPPRPGKAKGSGNTTQEKPSSVSNLVTREEINLSGLNKLKDQKVQDFVQVTSNRVPFRKGPGSKFKKLGIANKGERFKLLRIIPGEKQKPSWYLIKTEKKEKVFISSLFTEIVQKKIDEPSKIVLKEADQISPAKIRSVVRAEPPLPQELKKAKHITLNFDGTDVYDVITTFCELLQIDYLIEGKIGGKITLQTFNKIPAKDLYSIFEQIMAVNNISIVKSGSFYRFLPMKDAARKPLSLYYGSDSKIPAKDRLVVQIIPLKHIAPASLKKVLDPTLSANASLEEIPDTSNLMLIEMASNVKRLNKMIRALDVDKLASSDIHLYRLNHSNSEEVVEDLLDIFTSIGYGNALEKSLTFLPIQRLNSILVVSSLDNIQTTVEFWVDRLDQPISGGKLSTFVYYIQNAEAEKLSSILTSIFEEKRQSQEGKVTKTAISKAKDARKNKDNKSTKQSKRPKSNFKVKGNVKEEFEGEIHIIPDSDTNSLIIRTHPRNYPAVLELVKKLDLLPQQVLIEVLILDLTLDEQTLLGLEWALKGTIGDEGFDGGSKIVGGGSAPSSSTLGSQIGTATSLFAPGASFFVQRKDKLLALLQAFASDSKINIVANPILVTSDNKEAKITITDDIPIQSSTITTPTAGQPLTQSTIEFRDVGIKLDILPKINRDNFVNLKIDQEISEQGPVIQNTPSFTTRTLQTEVVLKDNEILVMGGLMRTTTSESVDGVPWLKDIPWLGSLFSTTDVNTRKTELMLFITPHIISNTEDSRFVTEQFRKKLGNLRKATNPSDQPS